VRKWNLKIGVQYLDCLSTERITLNLYPLYEKIVLTIACSDDDKFGGAGSEPHYQGCCRGCNRQ
jgi:hypothetical protein